MKITGFFFSFDSSSDRCVRMKMQKMKLRNGRDLLYHVIENVE